jgi:hypothetical protein
MKNKWWQLLLLTLIVLTAASCKQAGQDKPRGAPAITEVTVDSMIRNYNLQYGDKAEAEFVLTNTGHHPLLIKNVVTDCNCALGYWEKNLISPGVSTVIKLRYNYNSPGFFQRVATIYLNNSEGQVSLVMRGKISGKNN